MLCGSEDSQQIHDDDQPTARSLLKAAKLNRPDLWNWVNSSTFPPSASKPTGITIYTLQPRGIDKSRSPGELLTRNLRLNRTHVIVMSGKEASPWLNWGGLRIHSPSMNRASGEPHQHELLGIVDSLRGMRSMNKPGKGSQLSLSWQFIWNNLHYDQVFVTWHLKKTKFGNVWNRQRQIRKH